MINGPRITDEDRGFDCRCRTDESGPDGQIDGVDAPLEALRPQPSAEQVLAAKVEEAVAELAAEAEQKRLDAIKEAVKGEFKDTKSEKDVSDKLAQIKAARKA